MFLVPTFWSVPLSHPKMIFEIHANPGLLDLSSTIDAMSCKDNVCVIVANNTLYLANTHEIWLYLLHDCNCFLDLWCMCLDLQSWLDVWIEHKSRKNCEKSCHHNLFLFKEINCH